MNTVTVAIPRRWKHATRGILRFFNDPRRLRTASIKRFRIIQIPPLDEGQIWAFESSLDASQAMFVDAAIVALNTALNAKVSEAWSVTKEVTEQAQRDVDDLESIRAIVGAEMAL